MFKFQNIENLRRNLILVDPTNCCGLISSFIKMNVIKRNLRGEPRRELNRAWRPARTASAAETGDRAVVTLHHSVSSLAGESACVDVLATSHACYVNRYKIKSNASRSCVRLWVKLVMMNDAWWSDNVEGYVGTREMLKQFMWSGSVRRKKNQRHSRAGYSLTNYNNDLPGCSTARHRVNLFIMVVVTWQFRRLVFIYPAQTVNTRQAKYV